MCYKFHSCSIVLGAHTSMKSLLCHSIIWSVSVALLNYKSFKVLGAISFSHLHKIAEIGKRNNNFIFPAPWEIFTRFFTNPV